MSVTNAANVTQTCAQIGWCSMDYRFDYSYLRHKTRAGVSAAWMTLPKALLSAFMQVSDKREGILPCGVWDIEGQGKVEHSKMLVDMVAHVYNPSTQMKAENLRVGNNLGYITRLYLKTKQSKTNLC